MARQPRPRKTTGRHRGRFDSVFRPEFCARARALAAGDVLASRLAAEFQVNVRTITRWKRGYPAFAEALAVGREERDAARLREVQRRAAPWVAQRKRALGLL
jgi:hypothetical protein